MPPSWTNNTDPNVDFDTQGRAYQVTLPFNAFWEGDLHPNGAIDISYSDDLGRHWVKGNGGQPSSSPTMPRRACLGHVEDKQWVAVNHFPGNRFQDHVYAAWATFNGAADQDPAGGLRATAGRPSRKAITITRPPDRPGHDVRLPGGRRGGQRLRRRSASSTARTGTASRRLRGPLDRRRRHLRRRLSRPRRRRPRPDGCLPNTNFRDGILENFAASPTYPGHLYLVYEDWDAPGQFDVKFTQSTDGGLTWSTPVVNDNERCADRRPTSSSPRSRPAPAARSRSPSTTAGCLPERPGRSCPSTSARTNFCIDVSLQAYKDGGGGCSPGRRQRAGLGVHLGSRPARADSTGSPVRVRRTNDPCTTARFIGDYFGLAISDGNIYTFVVSTHYPSDVTADDGGPVYYQQQVLSTVPRADFGAGY